MKFMNFQHPDTGAERIGLVTSDRVADLSAAAEGGVLTIDAGTTLSGLIAREGALGQLESAIGALDGAALEPYTRGVDSVRALAPVPRPEKVIGIGLNYHDHAEEVGMGKPSEPFLFAMWANTIVGPGDDIIVPRMSDKIDYEAELAVVVGKTGRHIPEDRALDYIAGYTIVNDVSARDLQMKDNQWIRGKSFDTALPMGPVLVTTRALGDGDGLDIALRINGTTMQSSNTNNLIFKVPTLLAYISEGLTLRPGDIIATGTPGGVGFKRKPPVYLKAGDTVDVELEGIGILSNPVSAE